MTEPVKAAQDLAKEIEDRLRARMGPLLARYGYDLEALVTPLRWRPVVLVIGNYSSGKSTFINELLGVDVQRTGQAPTDDSFTVLTAPEGEEPEGEVPGPTLVNDERLPFASLRRFGEGLLTHFRLKRVAAPLLREVAVIDTPGMLDSVTEKDRGYHYLGVVGELAHLADLIILMFDPHKAGTIKETYEAIRSTLPEATGEDRVLYVLNRIDECENMADLVRAYGTLCWNLSQMTGRKDMPRIYLTFAPGTGPVRPGFEVWASERDELKREVGNAPRLRLSHILHRVEREIRELAMEVEALRNFRQRFGRRFACTCRGIGVGAVGAFLFTDVLVRLLLGSPEVPFLVGLVGGTLTPEQFLWPIIGVLGVISGGALYIQRFMFPRFVRRTLEDLDGLVPLDTAYRQDLWKKVSGRVRRLVAEQAPRQVLVAHARNLSRIERFLADDLKAFYERIQAR
ncbi:dynamin family protein [Dissulfurirhabdus thermomarina]|uniref:Dynamin family protein n=1 Tax=Dissulfurirhabdus thermomarina TaxID=1765737 RepID=A0A6N9TNN5_DISTH|nr:dynamin family protein [Dissulfurirhabdus thermomarina]NDY41703.1 dynamin family protein [Dissulfurirhabdus thermomarina]NMX23188.1 dynamin family protein [Dissulfurirhabdus thermomarina]